MRNQKENNKIKGKYFNMGAFVRAASNLLRNPPPNNDKPAYGRSSTAVNELPLITFVSSPCTTAINLSVVGSGPI